ncbi:hypothetical protein CPB83DRAFT_764683, partial [Crepidotus variabilis]
VYRVHWLKSRAQAMRWQEELKITRNEMEWTTRYFLYRAEQWRVWAGCNDNSSGHVAYARRQADMWFQFLLSAQSRFLQVNPDYHPVVIN